ncbi:MAG: cyclic nucleotide-binding domain-containing protein [Deltaproteobacteria bacterium]|nr:cyclic nucleotide-binding domain-containing protein [Deltaproteobacteria bacterium]
MRSLEMVLQRIGVQPAERGLVGWAVLCLFLMGAAAFALLNTAETLFLKRVGVDALPLALLASSGLLVLTTSLAGRAASRDPARWLPRILVGLALAPLPFVLLTDSRAPVVFGALLLVSRQVLALGVLAFWLAMGNLLPARRAKQLFAPLASGVTVGGIVGSFGSGPLAGLIGVEGLITLCVALLAGSAVASGRLRRRGTRPFEHALARRTGPSVEKGIGFGALLRSSRLFRLLGVALLCGGALSPVLYFEFTSVLDVATQGPGGEQQMLNYYSQFRGWLNVAMLGSQLWLARLLYRNLGLPLSLVAWPAAYALGLAWLGLDFALFAAFASFGAARLAEDGVADSAVRVLYNLFPDDVRVRASGFLGGPVNRLGGVLGNAFVLGALALGVERWVGWAALPVAGLWLSSSLVLWRAYPGLLLQASAEHGLEAGIDRAILLDAATLRSLAKSLVDPDPRVCRAAVDLVADGEPALVVALLAQAVEGAPPANRPLLVETLHRLVEALPAGSIRSGEVLRALASSLAAHPPLPPEQRADLLQAYARLTAGDGVSEAMVRESKAQLERSMGDRAAPVRLAAIAELHRRGAPPPGLPDLDRALRDALAASDALVRRAARKELRAMLLAPFRDALWEDRLRMLAQHLQERADRAETAEALRDVARSHDAHTRGVAQEALRYADDRDPRVRAAILCLAGHAGLVEEGSRLVSALGARSRQEAAGAREGLVALGSTAALPLLVGLEFGNHARREAVLAVLRELEVDAATLDALRARQLQTIREAVVFRAALEDFAGSHRSLLLRRLEERIGEGLGALLELLSALHDDPRLAELERRLRRQSIGRGHDLLIEAIEALLGRDEAAAIVPLLEDCDWRTRGEAAASALGRPMPASAAVLAELRDSSDTTMQLLAAAALALEGAHPIGDPVAMPSAMDIAVSLQDVPAFDRLSTQQLMSLAVQLQEQKVAGGERIYASGEEGLGLYFVADGEVELRRGDLVIERLGAGTFFGELSALDGVPRSSDAIAVGAARLLRLDRDDLLLLLEDSPELGIGLAQFLTSRVRRLVDRLEDASSGDGGPV